ncbi:MAG: protein kinase domain-containing protein [Isosphaeraceae bacterium]
MSRPRAEDETIVPNEQIPLLETICDRFETALRAGEQPPIETYLEGMPEPGRSTLLYELLILDLAYRSRDGKRPSLEKYLERFHDAEEAVRLAFAKMTTFEAAADAPNGPAGSPAAAVSVTSAWPPSSEGYELLRELGKGGQATTYLARDRALKRLVVIKRYHGVASSARRDAVLNEGRALARVRSPFVAACHVVEPRGDEIDLVLEFVPGRPLAELKDSERANTRRSARLIEQLAEGLAEVHACGLLHRDIKPRNIILGDDGIPRLVDFGLAAPVASEALHAIAGSVPYMAPEQARGQGERVDARTDVFGLGAVLYFLLTGKSPHGGLTNDKILQNAREARIIPPRQLNPRVPRDLERICLKAMAADPQSRFQSAEEFRRALGRYRLMRPVVPLLGACAASLALLVVSAWALWPTTNVSMPQPNSASPAGPHVAGPEVVPTPETKPVPLAELRVTRFEITHFPKLDAQRFDPRRVGALGRTSFAAREDDEVTVRAELSEPAYSYLVAFRPDGTAELCDPDNEDMLPLLKSDPRYPPVKKGDERYRLSEGTGLHAFALVVSRQPLPPYRQWQKHHEPMAWTAKLPGEPGIVWRADREGLQPLLADDSTGTRGKGVKARGSGAPVASLANWLGNRPGVDAETVEAFSVEPAAKP